MRFVVVALLALLAAPAGAADIPATMRYEDGRLTVRLEGVPLDRVVEMLGSETGVEFRGELLDWRDVTKRFDGVPLPEALDRLLGRQNFILRYGADGRPRVVELQGLSQPRPVAKAGAKQPQPNALTLLKAAPPVPLSPVLRGALRVDTARPTRLLRAALHEPDAAVRLEAGRAFLASVESNALVRAALARADPASLTPLVRSAPPERVDALLADLGRRSHDPLLRGLFGRTRTQLQQERASRTAGSRG